MTFLFWLGVFLSFFLGGPAGPILWVVAWVFWIARRSGQSQAWLERNTGIKHIGESGVEECERLEWQDALDVRFQEFWDCG